MNNNIVLKLRSSYSMVCTSSHFSFEKVRGRGGGAYSRKYDIGRVDFVCSQLLYFKSQNKPHENKLSS